MEFKYEQLTKKAFDEAVGDLKKSLEENKFGILWELNFRDKLREKGLNFDTNFMIFEVCNPTQAKEMLSRHIEVGYYLPCKLAAYEKNGSVALGMMKPTALIGMMGHEDLSGIAEDVENVLKRVIDNAVK